MILRICVVIPCFNHPRTISEVVKNVVNETPFPVLLLDEGSETPVANVLYSFEVKQALEEGRVRVVRFDSRIGRGGALQYAIRDLAASGYTHMVTFDAAGAFDACDINRLAAETLHHPWDLVIGNRRLVDAGESGVGEGGGRRNEAGRRHTDESATGDSGFRVKRVFNWRQLSRRVWRSVVRYETGSQVQDSRSRFRVYPLFASQNVEARTKGPDWELEVLIRLLWNGVGVREVEVKESATEVQAQLADSRAGNVERRLRHLCDSVRLWLLNAALVTLSLLRTHAEPRELGLAMGIGVFVGCTPAYGFHTVIIAILAVFLRMNFVALWVGTHVSTPVLFPLLFVAEVYVGQHWMGIPTSNGMMGHFYQWAVGGLILGVLIGVPAALVTYSLARSMQNPSSTLDEPDFLPSRHRLWQFLIRRFGLEVAYSWAKLVALWRYLRAIQARRGLGEYYRLVQPRLRFWERQKRVLTHFRRHVEMQMDELAAISIPEIKWTRHVHSGESEGRDGGEEMGRETAVASAVPAASAREQVAVTAHLGNWRMAVGVGEGHGPGGLTRRSSGSFGQNRVFFADRGRQVELIPFLGRLACFDVTGFMTGVREKDLVTVGFGVKSGPRTYDLFLRVPRSYDFRQDSAAETQLYDWTCQFVRQLEFYVRRYPDQWFNFYPFWSTRSAGARGDAGAREVKAVFLETLNKERRLNGGSDSGTMRGP